MYRYLAALLASLTLCCCLREQPDIRTAERVSVELSVRAGHPRAVTRSTDETAIRDLNFYLYDSAGDLVLHRYQTSATLHFECPPGKYRLRIAANVGRDLGCDADLGCVMVAHEDHREALPMTCEEELAVAASDGQSVMPAAVEVRRLVAKASYNLTVEPPDIELVSVRVCSVPRHAALFAGERTASPDAADYTDTAETPLAGRQASGTYYLLPNPQGTNPAITDQRQKDRDHAPEHASYLLIRARRGEKILAYRVYLGENNTDNFDLYENTQHSLDITIRGNDEVDTRVCGYTVSVHDNWEEEGYGGYCVENDNPKYLCVEVECGSDPPVLTCSVAVTDGDAAALLIEGKPCEGAEYTVSGGTNRYLMEYAPRYFNSTNQTLRYTVTVRDEYGFCRSFDFSHTFANVLRLISRTPGIDNGRGTVATEDGLLSRPLAGESEGLLALCDGSGCTLLAMPAAGFYFAGWFTDGTMTKRFTTYNPYAYHASTTAEVLYAKFALYPHKALDADGTANCYIAPKTNTRYSFDARTRGNGQTATGIVRPLAGTTARVIWETGTGRGSVIEYATCCDGRIYFATGAAHGNAVIGLFDNNGTCVWSWHIWAVDYDPDTSAVTYSSGAVFMDRNLGAESVKTVVPANKGLFYQWGRKDPFIFPATQKPTDNTTPATTYNLDGYEFRAAGRLAGDILPAGSHTVAWATAHPTVLLTAAPNPQGGETESLCSWLSVPNPKLWGAKKTIYDPCPPGWKVPARSAWDKATFKHGNPASGYGWGMFYADKTVTTFYPFNGYLSASALGLQYYLTASAVRLWTCDTYPNDTNDYGYAVHITDQGAVSLSAHMFQYDGYGIRCVRE